MYCYGVAFHAFHCKGVRCARLCTLFQVVVAWLDNTVSHFRVIVNKNFYSFNHVSLQCLTLHYHYIYFVDCILSRYNVIVKNFFLSRSKVVSFLRLLYYHVVLWLSTIDFKKYDKIIMQTYVRVCSAQTVQIWFYRTFVLSENNGQYISIRHSFYI